VKKGPRRQRQYGPVLRTVADCCDRRLDLQAAVQSPLLDRQPPITPTTTLRSGSFGLGSEDEAGIYDEPGQVLSVALTRSVRLIFQRQDLRNLMLEDDIKSH